jgi:O-methyltransferase involved in polyketide biosynthesis
LAWKLQRLKEIGFSIPDYVHFVPVDFETSYWWKQLMNAGFNFEKYAVVAFTAVTSYVSKETIIKTLR